jgi:transposase
LRGDAQTGACELAYLDESGFAPTLPTGHTWARQGVRPYVHHEYPIGRRVHAIGALTVVGDARRLVAHTRTTRLDAQALLDFIWRDVAQLPAPPADLAPDYVRPRPLTVVLDNYGVHHCRLVKATLPALARAGVTVFYLPPYSPELNLIEPEWRVLKYEGIPIRSHTTATALKDAVDVAIATRSAHYARLIQAAVNSGQSA